MSAGLGVFSPFGLRTSWPDDWEGRYLATDSEMETIAVNPALSLRILPRITVAAGVDFLWLDATLKKKINSSLIVSQILGSPVALPDAGQKFSGNGTGVGYNLGLLVDITESLALGVSYRSEIKVDVDGEARFSNVPPVLAGAFPDTDGKTTITLPRQLSAGLSFEASPRLILEAGMRWEDWSSFDRLKIGLDQPVAGQRSLVQQRDWHDSLAFNLGGRYRFNDTFALLAGYLYSRNPVPDKTFEPSIPDSDAHYFSVGTTIDFRRVRLALSYAYQFLEERKKENTLGSESGATANGRYDSDLHMVGVSLRYRF